MKTEVCITHSGHSHLDTRNNQACFGTDEKPGLLYSNLTPSEPWKTVISLAAEESLKSQQRKVY